MNFFKLFSPKKRAEEQERQIIASMRDDKEAARPLHYLFAHRLLPQLAYHHGIMAALTLGEPASEHQYLARLWEAAAKHLLPEDFIAPEGLAGTTQRVGEYRITIVTCPPPQYMPEVYFAAIVCGPISEAEEAPFLELAKSPVAQILNPPDEYFRLGVAFRSHHLLAGRGGPVRYYTLESGETETGEKRTVLCAWTPVGEHLNFGDGAEPTVEAFLAQVVATLSETPLVYGSASPEGLRGPDGVLLTDEEVERILDEKSDGDSKP